MPDTVTQSSAETIEQFRKYVVPNYARFPVSLVRGEGSYVWDAEGNRYLDFFPGWGCNLFGHCPPAVVEAVQEQIATLIHVPNTWHTPWQGQWAQALSDRSFGGQAFFCNSGTEANEAAIKLARLHTPKERYKIITFTGGFHGRTLGATSATAQPKYHEGLGPLMAGFVYAPFGDLNAVKNLIDRETAAILVEPIQGEGGINIPPADFLPGLRQLVRRKPTAPDVRRSPNRLRPHRRVVRLSALRRHPRRHDAGQSDLRRHGRRRDADDSPKSPPASAPACTRPPSAATQSPPGLAWPTSKRSKTKICSNTPSKSATSSALGLEQLKHDCNLIREVRVLGMMIGVELTADGAPIVKRCLDRRLLINCHPRHRPAVAAGPQHFRRPSSRRLRHPRPTF